MTLNGLVSDNTTYTPITGTLMLVNTGVFTNTNTEGIYTLILPPGVYTASAPADGFLPVTVTGIEIFSGTVAQGYPLHPVFCPAPHILEVCINIIDLLILSFAPTVSSTLTADYF